METLTLPAAKVFPHWELTGQIVGAIVRVHRELGPGLLESAYRRCLEAELAAQGLPFETEVAMPLIYRGRALDCGYRADMIVADRVLLELKAVRSLEPIHDAQVLTYLKLSGLNVALLVNFNAILARHGIRRFVR